MHLDEQLRVIFTFEVALDDLVGHSVNDHEAHDRLPRSIV
jgi:hypothetical protein